jgi:predicted DNA-binding transcriptional regulator AlpA
MDTRKFLRPREAAAFLGVSPATLAKRRCYGQPPAFAKLGASVVYDVADLERWVAQARRTSTSDGGGDAQK